MTAALDIRRKLAALVLSVVAALVASATTFSTSAEIASRRAALQSKSDVYARVAAKELEPAVAFEDSETAREVFASLTLDSDVHALALVNGHGKVLGAWGELLPDNDDSVISVRAPSISREGPRGVVVVQLTTAGLVAARHRTLATHLAAGLLALVFGTAASWAIGGSFARRIRKVGRAAQRVASGDLDVPPVVDGKSDEIGNLATDFNAMAESIRTHVAEIAAAAAEEQTRLDRLIAQRTHELSLRNESMRRVLDNVEQGFVTVGSDGRMSSERSAIIAKWFGEDQGEETLWDNVRRVDAHAADWFQVGWDALFDGVLPLELALEQLPMQLRTPSGDLRVDYKPIFEGDQVESVLLVISDVSVEAARERAESLQRGVATLCRHALEDRCAVEELMREGSRLVGALDDPLATRIERRRHLHTLKGNASFFGLDRVAHLCHEAESVMTDSDDHSEAAACGAVVAAWNELNDALAFLLGPTRANRFEVESSELEEIAKLVEDGGARGQVLERLAALRFEPVERRLQRVATQVRTTAARLGKHDIRIQIEGGGVRLKEDWAPFWASLVHVVRNVVDHGLEDSADRQRLGKPGGGQIVLRTFECTDAKAIVVEVEDDGRGIDWDALRTHCDAGAGEEHSELVDRLFADGVSTKTCVDEISGRGIGLAAVRRACEALGGRVHVESERGSGTRFSFRMPRAPRSIRPSPISIASRSSRSAVFAREA